jgi:hypothetical protein
MELGHLLTPSGLTNLPKYAGPEAEGSSPTIGLTLLWARNPFRGNFNHWQVSQKEARQILFRGLGEKEEELDKILNENNIKISVITESKKKLQGTKETEHFD